MLVLGYRKCSGCGVEGSLRLELREGGLWYRCSLCGFEEYVWSTSDDRRRLQTILERFEVKPHLLPPCVRRMFYKALEETMLTAG